MKALDTDLALFTHWLLTKYPDYSQCTSAKYVEMVAKFLTTNPNIDDIEDYNDFVLKNKGYGSYITYALKKYLDFKILDFEKRWKLRELILKLKRFDPKTERKYLKEAEMIRVLNGIKKEKHRIIALIQILTGLRACDVFRIEKGNIVQETYREDPVLRITTLGKGRKRMTVFIYDTLAIGLILKYINEHDLGGNCYFLTQTRSNRVRGFGKEFDEFYKYLTNFIYYSADLKNGLAAVGIEATAFATHDFRRGFATRVWEKYRDVSLLMKMLNHADASTTIRYLRFSGLETKDYFRDLQLGTGLN